MLVVAVVLVVAIGGYVVAGSIAPSDPIEVGTAVSIAPPLGWVPIDEPVTDGPEVSVELTDGSAVVRVSSVPIRTRADLETRYVGVLATRLNGLVLSEGTTDLPHGAIGTAYSGVQQDGVAVDGEFFLVLAPSGAGVVFDGAAAEGTWTYTRDDMVTMLQDAELR